MPQNEPELSAVAVVIPALNERDSLPLVLGDIPQVGQIIVVDNGSTDDTAAIAAKSGAIVVHEPRRGYGSACLAGIQAAIRSPACRVIVFLDADHSDDARLLPQIAGPVLRNEHDLVLGSRLLGIREKGAMPPQSVFGNRLACFLMRLLFNAKFTDLGPFRAISVSKLNELGMVDTNYGWTIEMQIKAHRYGLRYVETPVPYRCRVGTSKISGTISGSIKAGFKILLTIARYGLLPDKTPSAN